MTNDVFLQAADVVTDFRAGKGGLKALCYAKTKQPGVVYLLALRALCQADTLKKTITRLTMANETERLHNQVLVLSTEVFLGSGTPHRRRHLEHTTRDALRIVKVHRPEFEALLSTQKGIGKKVQIDKILKRNQVYLPRAFRVNLDKREYPMILREEDRLHITQEAEERYILQIQEELKQELSDNVRVVRHPILTDFFLVHTQNDSVPFHNLKVVKSNKLIMQSLSSGLPLAALREAANKLFLSMKNVCVLDVCAAPGSKALQACNYFSGVHANDINKQRCDTILQRSKELISTKVIRASENSISLPVNSLVVTSKDAMHLKDTGCQIIVCDPTCSSSGIYKNIDSSLAMNVGTAKHHAYLTKLSTFQSKLLTRLLTNFPSAMLVSYSTCSIHIAENEDVIASVLNKEKGLSKEWVLWNALPDWPLRGKDPFYQCLRADKSQQTDGFFVAIFVRRSLLEPNA